MPLVADNYSKVKPCNLSKQEVAGLAVSAAAHLGYAPEADLVAVLNRMGGTVHFKDFWSDEQAGSIRISKAGEFEVFLSSSTSAKRDRFTLAHEIGHYVLHYLLPRSRGEDPGPVYADRYTAETDRAEWEANWFAASFLMPEKEFRTAFEDCGKDTVVVARRFAVSPAAARVRAKTLSLI